MGRNFFCALLFALALGVQALAPAAARAAMGAASAQQTCVAASIDGPATKGQPFGHPDTGSARCDLCALCCGSLAPLGARSFAALAPFATWTAATWPVVENTASASRRDAVRARAPPTFS
jgi:hypothetical protein